MTTTCVYCKTDKPPHSGPGAFWFLRGYYGISGTFCSKCYDLVAHNSYGVPQDPKGLEKVRQALATKETT
jgi:hypothetical protein